MEIKSGTKLVTILFAVTLYCAGSFLLCGKANAQSRNEVIWESPVVSNISGNADDLAEKLKKEVDKITNAGHLLPFRSLYGEVYVDYAYFQRGDVVLTLSRAYPYLPPETQARVVNYLKTEMQNYAPWDKDNVFLQNTGAGTRREPDILTADDMKYRYSSRVTRLWHIYALWIYAQNTGDWETIENHWNEIKAFYNQHRAEALDSYSGIGGAIGMARLADHFDDAVKNQAAADAEAGMTAGRNFTTFTDKAAERFWWGGKIDFWKDWICDYSYCGFVFTNLPRETARYINSEPALRSLVLGETIEGTSLKYSLKFAEYIYPVWYIPQGPMWSRYYGEGSGIAPSIKNMLFPLHAWVLQDSADQLRKYVDTPDALLGDFYYIQNLVGAIEAYGETCWEDLQTEENECEISQPEVCSADSEYKEFADSCRDSCWRIVNTGLTCEQTGSFGCDCGAEKCWDGFVCYVNPADSFAHYGIEELIELVKYWGNEGPTGDIDSNSKVNIDDLIILVRYWGG